MIKLKKVFLKFLVLLTITPSLIFFGPATAYALPNEWPMFRKDSTHTGFSSEETRLLPPLDLIWKSAEPAGSPNSPAVADGKVFIEFSGVLYAYDAKTGRLLWSTYSQVSDHASVAVGHGLVFDGSGRHPECTNCGLVAYNIDTGQEVWRLNIAPKGVRQPVLHEGVLYFGSDDWYVRAADALTGQLLWTSERLNDGIMAVPAVADGKVFVGTWGGRLYALDASDGSILWYFLPPRTGVFFPSPSVMGNTIYFAAGLDEFHALDIPSRTLLWTSPLTADAIGSSPAIAYGMAYFISGAGTIYAVDLDDGSFVWEYATSPTTRPSRSSPAVANGVVYVGSRDGKIYGLDAFTGDVLWQYETGGPIQDSSPAIADGMLYIASGDGYLYAFGKKTPGLPVPDLKQYDPSWAEQIYNSATNWSLDPTIRAWGCALTSAAMVLSYHGHSVDPASLNSWLNSQSDGYIRNGLVNWLAVSRYTKQNQSPGSPALEFLRLRANDDSLQRELNKEQPPIVAVPGHFAVVRGTDGGDFLVNDPASTNTLLSQVEADHGGGYSKIYSYTPSETDLSYLMFVVNPFINLKVIGPDGDEISGITEIEDALVNDVDKVSSSGEPLKVVLIPKPEDGRYTVEATGTFGYYQLDTYVYDPEGNIVIQRSDSELANENQKDTFLINITEEPSFEEINPLKKLISDLDAAYKNGLIKVIAYRPLKAIFVNAYRAQAAGKPFITKIYLKIAKNFIIHNSSRTIDPGFADYLIDAIDELLKSEP